MFQQKQNLRRRIGNIKMHLSSSSGLGCSTFKGGGSVVVVVVDSMFIADPIVGVLCLIFVVLCST